MTEPDFYAWSHANLVEFATEAYSRILEDTYEIELLKQDLLDKFSNSKEAFYKSLPTFQTYGKGCLKRVADVQTSASTMLA